MKRILILSEGDIITTRLMHLYHNIYGHESKSLYLCDIPQLNCSSKWVHLSNKSKAPKLLKRAPNPMRDYVVQSHPVSRATVKDCSEIEKIIKEHQITTVLIPNFLYDEEKANHYNDIVRNITKNTKVDVFGIYI